MSRRENGCPGTEDLRAARAARWIVLAVAMLAVVTAVTAVPTAKAVAEPRPRSQSPALTPDGSFDRWRAGHVMSWRLGNLPAGGAAPAVREFTGSGKAPRFACKPSGCAAPYTVTQADIDSGELRLSLDIAGTHPSAQISFRQRPRLELIVSASPRNVRPGEQAELDVVVLNTGNVTLRHPSLTYAAGSSGPAIGCPAVAALAPRASLACTTTTALDASPTGHEVELAAAAAAPDGSQATGVARAIITAAEADDRTGTTR